eukprot:TRINITY_DN67102_c4_g2_i1.p1 TRINITY_DN67102_c4_g2~~TRINITY_DN67102_c4_g2_i1.p1  ORF type:complete len:195 (+),score=24.87 TRINITY_DN67102_c4_g2_i1:32-616(+)
MLARSLALPRSCRRLLPGATTSFHVATSTRNVRWCSDEQLVTPKHTPSEKIETLADAILALNLMEAKDLSDALKKRLGLEGALMAPMAAPQVVAQPAAAAAAPAAEEKKEEVVEQAVKSEVDIKLEEYPDKSKINLIREFRSFTKTQGLEVGLKEAKQTFEASLPVVLSKNVKREDAEAFITKLRDLGAKVKLV